MPDPLDPRSTLASRLAAALASQLEVVVPSGVWVAAEGTMVGVGDDGAVARTDVGSLLEEDVTVAARAVLDSVQDFVVETLTVPWPLTDEPSRLPLPHALWSGDRLRLFYGDPDNPVLELPGLSAAELEG